MFWGELIAAMETESGYRAIFARTMSSLASSAAIAPFLGNPCMRLDLTATKRTASSRLRTPAMQAPTYSPRLCPTIAEGSIPQERHNEANAYSTAKSAGCVKRVSLRISADAGTTVS